MYLMALIIGIISTLARWYDPALGRFAQADTVVPNPGDPVAWDRYAYSKTTLVRFANISDNEHNVYIIRYIL
jgi:hypothetical protein